MIRLTFLGLTTAALMLAGCSSQPIISPTEQFTPTVVERVSPPPSAIPSDSCANLSTIYAGSPIKPEVVIYSKNTLRKFPIEQTDDALRFYFLRKNRSKPCCCMSMAGR